MKNILNKMSEEEKQAILEQHKGGKTINTEKFSKLLESKLGDVKPLTEQLWNKIETQMTNVKTGQKMYFDIVDVYFMDNTCHVEALPRASYDKFWLMAGFTVNKGQKFVFNFDCDSTNKVEVTFEGKRSSKGMGEFTIDKQDAVKKIYNKCGCKKYTGDKFKNRTVAQPPMDSTQL
jgi:hypothetical protein